MSITKNVVITGSAGGIGSAAAEKFAANGWSVAVCYRTSRDKAYELADRLKAEYGVFARPYYGDITKTDEVMKMAEAIKGDMGFVYALVNNAGVAGQMLFQDISDDDWERMIGTDLTGTFKMIRAFLPEMVGRKEGVIINISSIWGVAGASMEAAYSAAKAGMIGMTKALAKELGPSGIRVNCVAPGVTDTPMLASLPKGALELAAEETPLGRIAKPEEIAEAIFYLTDEKAAFITGETLNINGGFVI
ncbi:MAG: 3-oxoacyl-ACP reductase FabG [Eubacteriales bacterium]|nr:3-oxoacyl-ACP reductase FabG [Eubacteriales bacterium]